MPAVETKKGTIIKERVQLAVLLDTLKTKYTKGMTVEGLFQGLASSRIGEKSLKEIDKIGDNIRSEAEKVISEVSSYKMESNIEKVESARMTEKRRLIELKKLKRGIDETAHFELEVIALSRNYIFRLEDIKTSTWKSQREAYLIESTQTALEALILFEQPQNIQSLCAKSMNDFSKRVSTQMTCFDLTDFSSLFQEVREFVSLVKHELKHSRGQLEALEAKYDTHKNVILDKLSKQLLEIGVNHSKIASNLTGGVGLKLREYAAHLNELETHELSCFENLFKVFEVLRNQLETQSDAQGCLEEFVENVELQRQQATLELSKNNTEINIRLDEYEKQILACTKKKIMERIQVEFEECVDGVNASLEKTHNFLLTIVSELKTKAKTELEQSKIQTKVHFDEISAILESTSHTPRLGPHLVVLKYAFHSDIFFKQWGVDNKFDELVDAFSEKILFEEENRINEYQYAFENRQKSFGEFLESHFAALKAKREEQEKAIVELAKELHAIRFDFDDQFQAVVAVMQEYSREIEQYRQQIPLLPRQNLPAFLQPCQEIVHEYLKRVSELLTAGSEDFTKRYSLIKKYQDAPPVQDNNADGPSELISNHKIWERALILAKEKSATLKLEYAKLTDIRLKDWLHFYQQRFIVHQAAMRQAREQFDDSCNHVISECNFIEKIEQTMDELKRNLKNETRELKAFISLLNGDLENMKSNSKFVLDSNRMTIMSGLIQRSGEETKTKEMVENTVNYIMAQSTSYFGALTHEIIRPELYASFQEYTEAMKREIEDIHGEYVSLHNALKNELIGQVRILSNSVGVSISTEIKSVVVHEHAKIDDIHRMARGDLEQVIGRIQNDRSMTYKGINCERTNEVILEQDSKKFWSCQELMVSISSKLSETLDHENETTKVKITETVEKHIKPFKLAGMNVEIEEVHSFRSSLEAQLLDKCKSAKGDIDGLINIQRQVQTAWTKKLQEILDDRNR